MKFVSPLGLSAIAAVALYQSVVEAWTITSSDAVASQDVTGPHQEFTKTWTVSGSEALTSLRFAAAGPVFVDYDSTLTPAATPEPTTPEPTTTEPATPEPTTPEPTTAEPTTPEPTTATPETSAPAGSDSGSSFRPLPTVAFAAEAEKTVAKIVLTGNCTDLLNVFEVIDHDGDVKVHFKNVNYKGYGYVLTQVYVADKDALTKLTTSGDSSVYISENVVANGGNATDVELTTSGDGDVFVQAPATAFSLNSLALKISGEGSIQFNASSITTSDFVSAKISGDGDIAVLASGAISVNNTLSTKISGEGSIYVQAETVETSILSNKISGDGYIAVSRNGSAVKQEVSISGEGTIETGSITAENTRIRLSGNGNVLVKTTNTLRVPAWVEGKIQYVGDAPANITDGYLPKPKPAPKPKKHHSWWWGDEDDSDDDSSEEDEEDAEHRLPKSVTQASKNTYKTYESRAVPAREPVLLILSLSGNWWSQDPNNHFLLIIFGDDVGNSILTASQSMAVRVKHHTGFSLASVAGVAGAVLVAAGIALRKYRTQTRRREYQPLLQVVGRN